MIGRAIDNRTVAASLSYPNEMAESLASMLEDAARRYAPDLITAGCRVLEGICCNDQEARDAARVFHAHAEDMIGAYIAALRSESADTARPRPDNEPRVMSVSDETA